MKNNYIIDTNILIVANNNASHVDEKRVNKCKKFVIKLFKNTRFSVDSKNLIFDEYFKYTSRKGEPGLGDALSKFIWDNQCNSEICEIVEVVQCEEPYFFNNLLNKEGLLQFDPSDLKFISVSLASKFSPFICNACDSDWKEKEEILMQYNIKIKEIFVN